MFFAKESLTQHHYWCKFAKESLTLHHCWCNQFYRLFLSAKESLRTCIYVFLCILSSQIKLIHCIRQLDSLISCYVVHVCYCRIDFYCIIFHFLLILSIELLVLELYSSMFFSSIAIFLIVSIVQPVGLLICIISWIIFIFTVLIALMFGMR